MAQDRRANDEKAVQGFVRNAWSNTNDGIPPEIVNLIFVFFHVIFMDSFKHFNHNNYEVSMNDRRVTKQRYYASVCYGLEVIPSTNGGIYHWKFKIKRQDWMAIGIDEAKYIRKDGGDFSTNKRETKLYCLYSDADGRKWDQDIYTKNGSLFEFEDHDTVMMILNLADKTLSYQINDREQKALFTDISIGDDIDYCLAVYISGGGDSIELCETNVQ